MTLLAHLESLLAAATHKGLWRATQDTLFDPVMLEVGGHEIGEMSTWDHRPDERLPDADLIVAAVNALPALIRIARAAEAWLELYQANLRTVLRRSPDPMYVREPEEIEAIRAALSALANPKEAP